ncbi:uncharacterized protein LOC129976471 [Argiope bruennichi]|uniref:uncharacterized protein LOC129976471 n=1 Tax=Argiope bruennichi TaxID=94029 RepID=UPI002494F393|nr:uncharacterized protein LOC129976471 [Argiope bruennichi]
MMNLLSIVVAILASSVSAYGYVCQNDDSTYYHADPSTACQVYHYCDKSAMTTHTCPSGQAFDSEKMKCMEAASVTCVDEEHHRVKRSIEVHSIALEDLKSGFEKLLKEMVEALDEALLSAMPTIHEELIKTYFPMIKSLEEDLLPLYKQTVSPRMAKAVTYIQKLIGRLCKKAYQSWEMSNSTHVNLVSVEDIVSDVSNDLKPVLQLGKYLSAKAIHSRHKRWTDDLARSIGRPIAEDIFDSFLNFLSGDQDTVMSKLILPTVTELVSDPETRFDMIKLIVSLKSAFAPVMNEMYKRQLHNTPPGTIIHLPQSIVDKAKESFENDSLPILGKLMRKHLRMILRKSAENLHLITEEAESLHAGFGKRLRHEWIVFMEKHTSLFLTDDSHNYSHIHTKTITEIIRDLQPIKSLIIEMFLNSMSTSPNVLFKFFSRADTVLMRSLF